MNNNKKEAIVKTTYTIDTERETILAFVGRKEAEILLNGSKRKDWLDYTQAFNTLFNICRKHEKFICRLSDTSNIQILKIDKATDAEIDEWVEKDEYHYYGREEFNTQPIFIHYYMDGVEYKCPSVSLTCNEEFKFPGIIYDWHGDMDDSDYDEEYDAILTKIDILDWLELPMDGEHTCQIELIGIEPVSQLEMDTYKHLHRINKGDKVQKEYDEFRDEDIPDEDAMTVKMDYMRAEAEYNFERTTGKEVE